MTTIVEVAIQKAVRAEIITATGWTVRDFIDDDEAFPYVALDNQFVRPDAQSPLVGNRDVFLFYPTFWSNKRGSSQVIIAMSATRARLHKKRLALDVGTNVRTFVDRATSRRDVDQRTYQGTMTIRAIVTH